MGKKPVDMKRRIMQLASEEAHSQNDTDYTWSENVSTLDEANVNLFEELCNASKEGTYFC